VGFGDTIIHPAMSKTLFWYLFRDLARIFLMASGTLAGIMSFGGLMRPLTENGLDAAQIGKMLTYLTPAMMAYSLPAAALFATTVTYGRLAADNELTACRAAGISYTIIGLPAVLLGLGVALFSLVLLCFIVPVFSLKVEQVIYSNLANVIVNKIQRNHQIRFNTTSGARTVFAEDAHVLPPDPAQPENQLVQLIGPTIVSYELADKITGLRVPKEFFTAQSATVRIHPAGKDATDDPGELTMDLVGGATFPRSFAGADQVGMQTATFGPIPLPSAIRENVKFMDVGKLKRLAADPSSSERVSHALSDLVHHDEEQTFLRELAADPSGMGSHEWQTAVTPSQTYILTTDGPPPVVRSGDLLFASVGGLRQVKLKVIQQDRTTLTAEAHEAHVQVRADDADNLIVVTLTLYDLALRTPDIGMEGEPAQRASWASTVDVAMDDAVLAVRRGNPLTAYASDEMLRREQAVVSNDVRAELHGRASFAVSCLILVLVGCALGMMFKSGNFLTAFAVSFVPALLCITLVVAGQQTADHVPDWISQKFLQHDRPLELGLALIWSGNVIVLAMAVVLIAKLRRR
jgi:lipopolysaccharide export LptBFGC system permease protein LptF